MLRASAEATGQSVDMRGVGLVAVDSGVPGDAVLSALTDAAVLRDSDEIEIARRRCVGALGPEATVRAAAVAANFEMMTRLADGTGARMPGDVLEERAQAIGVMGIADLASRR